MVEHTFLAGMSPVCGVMPKITTKSTKAFCSLALTGTPVAPLAPPAPPADDAGMPTLTVPKSSGDEEVDRTNGEDDKGALCTPAGPPCAAVGKPCVAEDAPCTAEGASEVMFILVETIPRRKISLHFGEVDD